MKDKTNILENLKDISVKSCFWFFNILFLECVFTLLFSKNDDFQWAINVLLSTIILSKIFTLLTSLGNKKTNSVMTIIILTILGILFSLQGVFYKIFKVYFSLYNVGLQDQVQAFLKDAISLILKNSGYILIFMLPLIVYLINKSKFSFEKLKTNAIGNLICSIILWIGIFLVHINTVNPNTYSTYDLYHNVNNIALNIKRLGVLNSYELEAKRIIFGYTPKMTSNVVMQKDNKPKEEKKYDKNQLELNFKTTDNGTINDLNNYINSDEATYKNEYTGIFKDYNLIYITAESFSEIGVSKELTPTLYKLTHNGFVFNNFYTPNNLSTIGGEFQSLTGLYPDSAILSRWRDGTNYFPYGLANTYRNIGYNTYAYHNNSYVFQDRNQYMVSQGFNNFLACYNGLEKRMNCSNWPESDDEMIAVTIGDYLNSDKPFLAYYMTVSGHFEYSFSDNAMSYKHINEVSNLNVSDSAKAYVATQIELDKALERLLSELEKANKLDNTVIVLMADHYPYELDNNAISELSGSTDDIGINHNNLIIWNNKLKNKEINKAAMSADVIPTVYNLFGIDYDSRLFAGRDILSDSLGVAVLTDRSWITDKGIYHAPTGVFDQKEAVDENYVNNVNSIVNNRLNYSRLVFETDYYRYLFG